MPALWLVWWLQIAAHGCAGASNCQATNVTSRFMAHWQSESRQYAAAAVWANLGLSPQGALKREIRAKETTRASGL